MSPLDDVPLRKHVQDQHWDARHKRAGHDDRIVGDVGALQQLQTGRQREPLRAEQHVDRPDKVVPVSRTTAPQALREPPWRSKSPPVGRSATGWRRRFQRPPPAQPTERVRTAVGRRCRKRRPRPARPSLRKPRSSAVGWSGSKMPPYTHRPICSTKLPEDADRQVQSRTLDRL